MENRQIYTKKLTLSKKINDYKEHINNKNSNMEECDKDKYIKKLEEIVKNQKKRIKNLENSENKSFNQYMKNTKLKLDKLGDSFEQFQFFLNLKL